MIKTTTCKTRITCPTWTGLLLTLTIRSSSRTNGRTLTVASWPATPWTKPTLNETMQRKPWRASRRVLPLAPFSRVLFRPSRLIPQFVVGAAGCAGSLVPLYRPLRLHRRRLLHDAGPRRRLLHDAGPRRRLLLHQAAATAIPSGSLRWTTTFKWLTRRRPSMGKCSRPKSA